MHYLIDNATNAVVWGSDTMPVVGQNVAFPDMRFASLNASNSSVVDHPEIADFIPGKYLIVGGTVMPNPAYSPPAPVLPSVSDYTIAVQSLLDTVAQQHRYDDIVSACSYAGAPNPFQAEGIKFVTWRGDVWAKCYAIMADVQSGTVPQPTVAALLAQLPAY